MGFLKEAGKTFDHKDATQFFDYIKEHGVD